VQQSLEDKIEIVPPGIASVRPVGVDSESQIRCRSCDMVPWRFRNVIIATDEEKKSALGLAARQIRIKELISGITIG
jgi:hypothetical protein